MTEPITIYPAIDILDGKCVRLFQGDYSQETVYNNDPVAVAREWKEQGAKFLHIVDLDGAKKAEPVNFEIIKKIYEETGLPIQTGGGIRDFAKAKMILDAGIERIIIGTSALKDKDFTIQALETYGERVAIGMDCRDGYIAVEGWEENSDVKAIDLALELKKHGLKTVIYTDISRDGTLTGPNTAELKAFAEATQIDTIASGGMSQVEDIQGLQALRDEQITIEGAIVGKALYTGNIKLREVL